MTTGDNCLSDCLLGYIRILQNEFAVERLISLAFLQISFEKDCNIFIKI